MATHSRQTFHLRTFRRIPIQGEVEFLNESLHGTGRVWNISLSGCRMDGSRDVKRGTTLSLAFDLPSTDRAVVVERPS